MYKLFNITKKYLGKYYKLPNFCVSKLPPILILILRNQMIPTITMHFYPEYKLLILLIKLILNYKRLM